MADIKDILEKWDGHTGNEVEKFLKQELAKKQEALRLGAGLERGENGVLHVVLGTEAPVTKSAGGLGLTNAGGLSLALGNAVLQLTSAGLSIGTSQTVTDFGGQLAVVYGEGLTSDINGLKVDYGTGLKLSGNKLIVDPDAMPSGGGWGKKTDGTLKFASDGETLGVNIGRIAGGGMGKSSAGKLEVVLGTEAPVTKSAGGLGLTNAGGLSLALGNAVLQLTNAGLSISTSQTVTDAGGQLAVVYGKGLTSDINGLKVDYGTGLKISGNKLIVDPDAMPSGGGWGKKTDGTLKFASDGETLGVNIGRIAGGGMGKSSAGKLEVVLGTEAPVTKSAGGLGLTNAGGLSLALGNAVLQLTNAGLSISTSQTVTDAGGQLAVVYGKGLTSDFNGLKVDYGTGLKLSGNKLIVDPDTIPRQTLIYKGVAYGSYVVLLCKYGAGVTLTHHRLSGRIYSEDVGAARYVAADIDIFVCDWDKGMEKYLRFDSHGVKEMDLITCNYEGVKYLAIRINGTQARNVYFEGTSTNMLLTPIKYYTSNTNTADNAEIHGSMAVIDASQPSSNGNKYALVTDTVARATADANGNNIATTYIRAADLGGGLEINSGKIRVKYSTEVLKTRSDGSLDVDIDKLKALLGLNGPTLG